MSIFAETIAQYKKYVFVAIAIDAGKIGSKNYLDILVCNSLQLIIIPDSGHFNKHLHGYILT